MELLLVEKYKYLIPRQKKVDIYYGDFGLQYYPNNGNVYKIMRIIVEKYKLLLDVFINASNVFLYDIPFNLLYENLGKMTEDSIIIKFIDTMGSYYASAFYKDHDFLDEIIEDEKYHHDLINTFINYNTIGVFEFIRYALLKRSEDKLIQNTALKMFMKNKKNAIKSCIIYLVNNEFSKKMIAEYCYYELLLVKPLSYLMNLIDINMVIKWVNDGYPISEAFMRKLSKKDMMHKELSRALIKKSIYFEGQYIDVEILTECNDLFKLSNLNDDKLFKYIEKYKDANDIIHNTYLIYLMYNMNSSVISRKEIETLIKSNIYKFTHPHINFIIIKMLIDGKYFDLFENIFGNVENIIIEDIDEIFLEKCPYAIWMLEKVSTKYKKYYYMKETYKYFPKNMNTMYFENINDHELLSNITKSLFKYRNMLPSCIMLDINNNNAEKFFRESIRINKNFVKHYIINTILRDIERYRDVSNITIRYIDIINGISDFKWEKQKIDINFIFF